MKLIINTSNLYVGGGVQVALSFINELKLIKSGHQYHIFLSTKIAEQIDQKAFPESFYFYFIEKSPASLKTRKQVVSKLDALEERIKPDVVFSIFGPSYWTPRAKHIMGFAIPWVLQKDSVAYRKLDFFERIKMRLWVKYVSFYAKKNISHYIIETEDAKKKLSNTFKISTEKISVVGNSYSSIFENGNFLSPNHPDYIQLPPKEKNEFRLLLISHNYPHKNIEIINKIVPLLDINVKFVLTIDQTSYQKLFPNENKQVLNLGPVKLSACPSLYKQCDAMFLPTLLEVFSAAYPEAMKMEKPILTSNYSFATDICQDAALYFDPLDPEDIADKIKKLVSDKFLQKTLVERGKKRVKQFETAKSRAEKYISICEKIANGDKI